MPLSRAYARTMVRWVLKKWPIVIEDDRGREVALVGPPKFARHEIRPSLWKSGYSGTHAGLAMESEAQNHAMWLFYIVAMLFCSCPVQYLALWMLDGTMLAQSRWAVLVLFWLIVLPLYPLARRVERGMRKRHLRRAYLASQHCASCNFPLLSRAVEEDGCRVCSECGAAWRMASPPADVQSPPA